MQGLDMLLQFILFVAPNELHLQFSVVYKLQSCLYCFSYQLYQFRAVTINIYIYIAVILETHILETSGTFHYISNTL